MARSNVYPHREIPNLVTFVRIVYKLPSESFSFTSDESWADDRTRIKTKTKSTLHWKNGQSSGSVGVIWTFRWLPPLASKFSDPRTSGVTCDPKSVGSWVGLAADHFCMDWNKIHFSHPFSPQKQDQRRIFPVFLQFPERQNTKCLSGWKQAKLDVNNNNHKQLTDTYTQ